MKDVIIIGCGGHGKVIADIVRHAGDNLLGFLDRDTSKTTFLGKPVLGADTEYYKFPSAHYIIAIGNASIRARIAQNMENALWNTAIHPSAEVSPIDTKIEPGTAVMARAIVNPGAKIGKHCIINSGATVEHDNLICDYAHISVGATLAGDVHIGECTWIGAGATVSNGISICAGCMIGAGTVVVKSITEPGTYVGVPSRRIK